MVRDKIITILKEGLQDTVPPEQLGTMADRIWSDVIEPRDREKEHDQFKAGLEFACEAVKIMRERGI